MRDIATVSFKVAALFIALFGLRFLPGVIAALSRPEVNYDIELTANFVMFVAPLVIAFGFWWAAERLASRLFQPDSASPLLGLAPAELHAVAFSVVGLALLVSSIRDVVWSVIYLVDAGPNMPQSNIIGGTASAALTVLVGIWLLLGSKGIVGVIRRLRGE